MFNVLVFISVCVGGGGWMGVCVCEKLKHFDWNISIAKEQRSGHVENV